MSNQTPYAWAVTGEQNMYLGDFAEHDAKLEAACCGGTARAFPLYTAPIQQIPMTSEQIEVAIDAWFHAWPAASMQERMKAAINAANGDIS